VSEVSARTNRVHTQEETESIRKELQENVNRTVPYQYRGDYQKDDLVWVRICEKNSQNPKLGTKYERGIIVERLQQNAYKVKRLDRPHKKVITLNVMLFKPRFSENPPQDEEQQPPLAQPPPAQPAVEDDDEEMQEQSVHEEVQRDHEDITDSEDDDDFHGFPDQEEPARQLQEESSDDDDSDDSDDDSDDDFFVPDYSVKSALGNIVETIVDYNEATMFKSIIRKNGDIDFDKLRKLIEQGWSLQYSSNYKPPPLPQRQQRPAQAQQPAKQGRLQRLLKKKKGVTITARPPEMSATKKFKKAQERKSGKPLALRRLLDFLPDGKRTASTPEKSRKLQNLLPDGKRATSTPGKDTSAIKFGDYISQLVHPKPKTKAPSVAGSEQGSEEETTPVRRSKLRKFDMSFD
jgi:hypothetical protein